MSFPGKNIKFQKIHLLLAVGFIIFFIFDYRWLDIATLQLYTADDYGFHGILRKMYNAITDGNFKRAFQYNFYSYGYSFFLLNEILCFPFIAAGNIEMVIFIPRMVSAVCALVSVYYIYKLSRLYISEIASLLIVIFIMSMPAFWRNAVWFHPDWMMTCFLVISCYHLAIDQHEFGKNYRRALIFMGMAAGVKVQAITFIPLVLGYIFYDELTTLNFRSFALSVKRAFKAGFIVVLIFVLNNPYLLHPKGLRSFVTNVAFNMESNASNHFTYLDVTFMERLQVVDEYYLNYLFFALLLLLNIFIIVRSIVLKEKNVFFITALSCIVNLIYLFVAVNKAWQHYYISSMLIAILALIPATRLMLPRFAAWTLAVFCLLQFAWYFNKYPEFISRDKNAFGKPVDMEKARSDIAFTNQTIGSTIRPEHYVLVSPFLPFDQEKLGVPFEHVRLLFGYLKEEHLFRHAFFAAHPTALPEEFFNFEYIIFSRRGNEKIGEGSPAMLAIQEEDRLIELMKKGEAGYDLLSEKNGVYIFKKRNH
jgi:4-amino-4-deoxy-L-arabinose transferase-like glycosyltransferase